MARLNPMPQILPSQESLAEFGQLWLNSGARFDRRDSMSFGRFIDENVANALAVMLGNIEIVSPNRNALMPELPDCVEIGDARIVGGVRPQNFDVVYRPDGVRFAFDSKTLNDADSVPKNWQNMINDLATEATTVHSRFPHALVAFIVAIPHPAIISQESAIIETLERLARRENVVDPPYMAETISLVVWDPEYGTISSDVPQFESPLRIENFSEEIEKIYRSRYKGLPPHD